ncbi:MAG: cytochrome c [Planctomycetota bacterium]
MALVTAKRIESRGVLWRYAGVLSLWVSILAVLATPGCDGPNFATEADIQAVLNQPRTEAEWEALADEGRRAFLRNNCQSCHVVEGATRGAPRLANLYTTQATLIDGRKIDRDRGYLIRSIIQPQEYIVAGYPQQMSSFRHRPAEEVAALVAYLERFSPLPKETDRPTSGDERNSPQGLPNPQE